MANEFKDVRVVGGNTVYSVKVLPTAIQEIRAVSAGNKYTIEFTLLSGRTYTYVNSSNEHLFNDLPTAQQEADSLANTIEGLLTVVTDGGGFGEES